MVKADKNKEMRWRQSSKTSNYLRLNRPAVGLDNLLEEAELRRGPGEITSESDESEEVQEQSESQPRPANPTSIAIIRLIIQRVVGYCRVKELFIIGFVLLCIQLSFLRNSPYEANREEMVDVINKLIIENERFKSDVLVKIKDIDKALKLHKDDSTESVADGLSGLINIPFAYPIDDALKPGLIIYISGRPSANPNRFTLNFQSRISLDPPPDIAFHFDVRFSSQAVIRNSLTNNVWGKEEAFIPHFPFKPATHFDMIIRVDQDRFRVALNGQHLVDFKHRLQPLSRFDILYIKDDIVISSINFE